MAEFVSRVQRPPQSAVYVNQEVKQIKSDLETVKSDLTGKATKEELQTTNDQLAENAEQIDTFNATIKYAENFPVIAPETDDTARLQRAIYSFSSGGKGVIYLAPKKYDIKTLNVPSGISLIGVYSFDPSRSNGTWFYCTDTINPAIRAGGNQLITGVSFYYPEQIWDSVNATPKVYPPSIEIGLDAKRILMRDVFFQNTYFAIDANRHHEFLVLQNIQGYAINLGVVVDYTSDIDRFTTVHFNPNAWNPNVFATENNMVDYAKWTRKNGVAFKIRRADWINLFDCFCWGYRKGLVLESSLNGHGAPSGVHVISCGFDAVGIGIEMLNGWGIKITDTFFTSFNAFVSNEDMSDFSINISGGNDVSIKNCRFWGVDRHAIRVNNEHSIIESNMFYDYGKKSVTNNVDYRAIIADIGTHHIVNNQFKGNGVSKVGGVLMNNSNSTVMITKNTFDNFPSGTVPITNIAGVDGFIIEGNIYKNCINKFVKGGTPSNYIDANNLVK